MKGGCEMWEKILLATAVTFSLHIFAGIDLSDIKSPVSSLSPSINTADSKLPNLSYVEETFPSSTLTNIKTFIDQ
ncbi:hypothetical protein AFK68_03000 [Hydrocoleum sp. CS-953]|nr:hypothetical protein AFK68_03000 [Hydrocoleum sp. CS-953]